MATLTLGEIRAAMDLIEEKKQNLHESFQDLHSHSPFSFTLKWSDVDSYFTTLRSSLDHKFQTLDPSSTSVLARPELKSFCQNSEGLRLRSFIIAALDRASVAAELPDAYRYAPDAAAMVLDAMECGNAPESHVVKSACVTMLEGLMRLKPEVTPHLRDKAMTLALQWKKKTAAGQLKEKEQTVLGFLLLVAAYGLIQGFSTDDFIDCFVIVAKRRQALNLCSAIIPDHRINDLIQRLINKDLKIAAVRFSVEFQKNKEFPPVSLLEEHRLRSKSAAEEMRKKCKNLRAFNEATMKEINALRSIIRCVEDCELESEYPKAPLVDLAEKLEKEIESRKRAPPAAPKNQQQQPKKPKPNSYVEAAAAVSTLHQQAAENVGPMPYAPNPYGPPPLPLPLGYYHGHGPPQYHPSYSYHPH